MINPDLGSWCEISVEAIAANISTMRQGLSLHTKLGIVVKGNAYGHGLVLCAREFVEAGADWLVVNSATEAAGLRAAGIGAPVYICGPIFPAEAEEIARIRASAVISDAATASALARAGCEAGRTVLPVLSCVFSSRQLGIFSRWISPCRWSMRPIRRRH